MPTKLLFKHTKGSPVSHSSVLPTSIILVTRSQTMKSQEFETFQLSRTNVSVRLSKPPSPEPTLSAQLRKSQTPLATLNRHEVANPSHQPTTECSTKHHQVYGRQHLPASAPSSAFTSTSMSVSRS